MEACMFPGQGSQSQGMGQGLFERYPDTLQLANEILGYSIDELCLNNPDGKLALTQYTQPAIYVVNALHYLTRREDTTVPTPDYLLGHSLGEYNALLAGGVFDFSTGLQIVKRRAELMSQANGGAMAAIVGPSLEDVRQTLAASCPGVDIANINTNTQTVISGTPTEVQSAMNAFEAEGAKAVALNVSAAFHSRQMKQAAHEFSSFLEQFKFRAPRIPVISNVTTLPYDGSSVGALLSQQLRQQVRWLDSIRYLQSQRVTSFVEVGSGKVLTRMLKKIQREDKKRLKAA